METTKETKQPETKTNYADAHAAERAQESDVHKKISELLELVKSKTNGNIIIMAMVPVTAEEAGMEIKDGQKAAETSLAIGGNPMELAQLIAQARREDKEISLAFKLSDMFTESSRASSPSSMLLDMLLGMRRGGM